MSTKRRCGRAEPGGEWLDEWLATSHDRLAGRTLESYNDTVRLRLRPVLGSIPLSHLNPGHVAR